MKYDLGIIGGLGPLASSYLYELITKNTKADKDQEHLNIVIFHIYLMTAKPYKIWELK